MRNYSVGIKYWLSQTRAVEGLQQKKYTQERDAEARIKEQNALILQRQAAPYFGASRAAATLGSAIAPNSYYRSISQKAMQEAMVRFEQLLRRVGRCDGERP
jgi:hypothetical protein